MQRLWQVQRHYYWQLIHYRFWLIGYGVSVVVGLVGLQLQGDLYPHIVIKFFAGPTALDLRQREIIFPSLWLGYYLFPLIIVGNSFKLLWQHHAVQLFGYRFSKANFGQLNLILVSLLALAYTMLEIGSMVLITQVNHTDALRFGLFQGATAWLIWGLLVYAEVLLVLLMQLLSNLVNTALGLFGPTVLLVFTIYWSNRYNPLNLSIFQRAVTLDLVTLVLLLGSLVSLMCLYLYCYRRCEAY